MGLKRIDMQNRPVVTVEAEAKKGYSNFLLKRGNRKKNQLISVFQVLIQADYPSSLPEGPNPCSSTFMFLDLQGVLTSRVGLEGPLYPLLASLEKGGKVEFCFLLLGLYEKVLFLASVGPLNVFPPESLSTRAFYPQNVVFLKLHLHFWSKRLCVP